MTDKPVRRATAKDHDRAQTADVAHPESQVAGEAREAQEDPTPPEPDTLEDLVLRVRRLELHVL